MYGRKAIPACVTLSPILCVKYLTFEPMSGADIDLEAQVANPERLLYRG